MMMRVIYFDEAKTNIHVMENLHKSSSSLSVAHSLFLDSLLTSMPMEPFIVGLWFSVVFANVILSYTAQWLLSRFLKMFRVHERWWEGANDLIKGQTQVGLLIFLWSTIGLTFVAGLFEHRAKILSYGDYSSSVWEGPLLVVMYWYVDLWCLLIQWMLSSILAAYLIVWRP